MDYATSKIVLWIMLCLPILIFGVFALSNVAGEIVKIRKLKKARFLAAKAEHDREVNTRRQRALFEAQYDDYLSRKYAEPQQDE